MPSPHAPSRGSFLLRPGEWALLAAIVLAIAVTTIVDANHSYWFRPLESLRDIARNTALLGIFALGATVVIIAGGIDLSALVAFIARQLAQSLLGASIASLSGGMPY